ncbi:MAG: TonB-dependent receptor [Chitinophagaceae bacterium]
MYWKSASSLFCRTGFSILFLLGSLICFAQNTTIKGTVRDANGLPLSGASVLLEGTRTGTITDANGSFSINVTPGTYTIVTSYVGVQTQRQTVEVPTGGLNNISFNMQNSGDLNRVVVVGSRSSAVRSSTQTVAPVDVITARELQATGQVEPTQMLNVIAPSFNSSRQTIADGTDHIDPATLRGLGPDQVLVLVNGRRRYNSALLNLNGTIGRGAVGTDMNAIPAAAIERIEVLRDGASSQYGSDAIGGVINVVMKKNTKGSTVYSHFGQHYEEDGGVRQVGFTQGFQLGKEGYLTFSGDLRQRDATNRVGDYRGTVYTTNVAADEILIAQRGFSRKDNMHIGNSKVGNAGFVVNLGAPITSNIQFFLTGSINAREGKAAGFYRYPRQTSQVIRELYPDGFLPFIYSSIQDKSVMAGLEGKTAGGINWDISQTSGGNSFRFDVKNTNNASQYALREKAQTEFYAGTLKFNQHTTNLNATKDFGTSVGLPSFNVAAGAEFRIDNYVIVAGEEASYKNYDVPSGRAGGSQVFPGFEPQNAVNENRQVYGAYVDLESDVTDKFLVNVAGRYENYSDFGSNVAGKLAMRYKIIDALSVRASLSNGFRAPSMHQRYLSNVATVFVNSVPVQQGTFRNNSVIAEAFGIPSLTAEKSTNLSAGLTSRLKGGWNLTVDGYQIKIKDRIVLTGSFSKSSPVVASILANYPDVNAAQFFTNAIDTRTRGIDFVISKVTRMGVGNLTATLAANFTETEVSNVDPLPQKLAADPSLGTRLLDREQRARIEVAQPRNKISAGINYNVSKVNFYLRSTRYGEVTSLQNDLTKPFRDQTFDARIITDASVGYKLLNFATFTIGATNIGNIYPERLNDPVAGGEGDIITSFGRFLYSRAATQFGFNGGYYYTSLVLDIHNIGALKKSKK